MPRVEVDGVTIHYEVTGNGRPVLLLHGFADTGRLWRHQVPALAEAGFKVIVPELRGHGSSDKPESVEAYALPFLAGDILGVLADAGESRAHVVGHDWGAAVEWGLGSLAPDNVDHLAVLSVGFPSTFLSTLEQHEKSWYMLLFQFPDIAERWLSENDWHNFKWWGRHPDSDAVIAKMVANGSLTPGLNYYRANVNPESWVGPPLAASPGASPHDGTVEQRRLRTHGVTDDRLGEECRGSVALRAARRTWPLDATQSTGGRKPLVARLPPQLIGKARAAIRCELSRQRNTDED